MGLFRKRNQDAAPKSVVAAAVPLSGPGAVALSKSMKPGTEDWQKEAWYHYDACGEFRSAVTWIANAVSKADVMAMELDPDTGDASPVEDARIQAIAQAAFGGHVARAQMLQTLAVHWQVPGETFIVIHPAARPGQPDRWMVVSGTRMVHKGGSWQYQDPFTMVTVHITSRDRLIRVWAPHPNDGAKADSAARPALPILREIERSTQNIMARLVSRLAGNGILFIPSETDFPRADGESLGEAFGQMLLQIAEVDIKTPGQASGAIPMIAPLPGEMIGNIQHLDFATEFNQAVADLREQSLSRLAATLDMPNETAEGSTGGMNHWGAWAVEESTYKIYIQPLLDRLGDAVTQEWFVPALEAAGVANPERYVIGWNTSSIVSRPDRTGELKELWDDVLISDEYRLAELGVPDDAMPDEAEKRRREMFELVKVAPTLLADPNIGRELFGFEVAPAAVSVDPAAAELPAGEEVPTAELPAAPEREVRPDDEAPDGLVAAAELIVFDAMTRAGGRLLTREHRGQFGHVHKSMLYMSIPYDPDDIPRLIEGSFEWAPEVAEQFGMDPIHLQSVLTRYTQALLRTRRKHDRRALRDNLKYVERL